MSALYLFNVVLVFHILTNNVSHCLQCQVYSEMQKSVHLTSRRNLTGHWISQVEVKNLRTAEVSVELETGSWDIHIQHSSENCDSGELITITAAVVLPPKQPNGYEFVPTLGFYKLHLNPKPWDEARKTCSMEGTHLAILNSQEEVNIFKGILEGHPIILPAWRNNVAWVGFHDKYKEGEYVTVFGVPLEKTGFSLFNPGHAEERQKNEPEDCGVVSRNGFLLDEVCSTNLSFFCEQELW